MGAYRLTKEWQEVTERDGVIQNTCEQNIEFIIVDEGVEPLKGGGKIIKPRGKDFFELRESEKLYVRAFEVFAGIGFVPTVSVDSIVDYLNREQEPNPLEGTTNSLTIGLSIWSPKTSYYPEDWCVIAKNLLWKCTQAHDNDSDFDADVARGYWQNVICAINSIVIDGTDIVLTDTRGEVTRLHVNALTAVQDADGNVITDTYATKTELSDEVETLNGTITSEVGTLNDTISNVEDGLVRSVTKKDDTTITVTKGDNTTTDDIQFGTQTYATKTELSDAVDDVEDDIDAVDDTYSFLIRKPSTPYTYGTKVFLPSLNVSMCLQCTVAGTTSNTSLVISNPTVDDTVTDGTCEWTIKEIGSGGSGGDGVPVGAIIAYAGNGELPSGYMECDHSEVSRTMFADLYAKIGTTYGAGDGSTTFNLPSEQFAKAWVSGDTAPVYGADGKAMGVQVATTNHPMPTSGTSGLPDAYLGLDNSYGANFYTNAIQKGANITYKGSTIDSNVYADLSSATITPQYSTNIRYIIKAFDGQTPDSALIDITQYAQELATKANRQLSNLDTNNLSVHVVVDSYYDSTTGDWYRVYDDGWVEQGGRFTTSGTGLITITMLKAMADTKYTIMRTNGVTSTTNGYTSSLAEEYHGVSELTTTTFKAIVWTNNSILAGSFSWMVCGQGA